MDPGDGLIHIILRREGISSKQRNRLEEDNMDYLKHDSLVRRNIQCQELK